MECKDCLFLFDDYIDKELGKKETSKVSSHLAACPSCALVYRDFRRQQEDFERYFHNVEATPLLWKNIQEAKTNPLQTVKWWQGLFETSISIPIPVFATALIFIAAAFISANVFWKKNAAFSEVISKATAPITATNPISSNAWRPPAETIEKTKTVEVPVIKERVVMRFVYVERQKPKSLKTVNPVLVSNRSRQSNPKANQNNISINGITAEKGYFTQIDLSKFQPTNETKVRVIREVEDSDK